MKTPAWAYKAACFLMISVLQGCIPNVYRVDIPQGNIITEQQIQTVEVGMNPRQVLNLLGTPLITDPFNQERWDYIYRLNAYDGTLNTEKITIVFQNNQVYAIRKSKK